MKRGLLSFVVFFGLISTCEVTAQTSLPDSLHRFARLPKDSAYINALNILATTSLRNNPAASRKIAQHVAEVAQEINYTKGFARAVTITGNSYWYEGVFELAQSYYLQAAREYQVIGDSIGLGQTYNNIGEVYKRMGNPEKALEFLLKSIELKKQNVKTRAITLYNIGELYLMMGDLTTANEYFDNSISQAIHHNDKRVIAYNYIGFGLISRKQNKLENALEYFSRAEKILAEIGEIRILIQAYHHLADTYNMLRLPEKVDRYLTLAEEMALYIKATDLLVTNYLKQSQLDSLRGDYTSALKNLNKHIHLKDSVFNITKTEQIARMQTVYQTEVQEAENRKLRSEKALREVKLKQQRQAIIVISIVLSVAAILTWVLLVQRKKILSVNNLLKSKSDEINSQKIAIELQASALIKLNEELQQLNKTLEDRIEERTQQLSLQNQKLTEYTFVNAHKLRAPVSSILGLINLMEQVGPTEKEIILNHLKTCSEQLDLITRQISRTLESGIIEN
ncbi:MAG: tetratricopeptide repeat-containing sensor histidine kinase [Cyclobacteriaceae bacterium]|nr:tetratricopeptide repeat-containing sensor histidine kinase [Cyclobacteriaceae bacterium]